MKAWTDEELGGIGEAKELQLASERPDGTLRPYGGLALYFLTHVGLRLRLVAFIRHTSDERPGWIGPGRVVTFIVMLALIPVALEVPALASLALVTAVCCALIAWDVIHYREDRAEVRRARP